MKLVKTIMMIMMTIIPINGFAELRCNGELKLTSPGGSLDRLPQIDTWELGAYHSVAAAQAFDSLQNARGDFEEMTSPLATAVFTDALRRQVNLDNPEYRFDFQYFSTIRGQNNYSCQYFDGFKKRGSCAEKQIIALLGSEARSSFSRYLNLTQSMGDLDERLRRDEDSLVGMNRCSEYVPAYGSYDVLGKLIDTSVKGILFGYYDREAQGLEERLMRACRLGGMSPVNNFSCLSGRRETELNQGRDPDKESFWNFMMEHFEEKQQLAAAPLIDFCAEAVEETPSKNYLVDANGRVSYDNCSMTRGIVSGYRENAGKCQVLLRMYTGIPRCTNRDFTSSSIECEADTGELWISAEGLMQNTIDIAIIKPND